MTTPPDYAAQIARELKVRQDQIAAAIELFDAGNTVPFIARYRKERTGNLDEEQIRQTGVRLEELRALDERRAAIIASITEQGKLTPELHAALLAAGTRTALEDLYAPHRPKRRTRAMIARERGLGGLAEAIVAQQPGPSAEQQAARFLSEQVPTAEEALARARDIVAEQVSEHPDVRRVTREKALQWATLRATKVEQASDERAVYQTYYDFQGQVGRLKPYQVLAINRGEQEKVLRVALDVPERDWRGAVALAFRPHQRSPLAGQLQLAIDDAAARLLLPAIERDVRAHLSEQAAAHAIAIFAKNLRGLLSQPPLLGQTVLGLDPGFRTGCKLAVVDPTGRLLHTATIYPHTGGRNRAEALATLATLTERFSVTLIAIGNGTASRETEQLVAELIRMMSASTSSANGGDGNGGAAAGSLAEPAEANLSRALRYLIVSEAGASVYSASPQARAELPDLDVSLRGAVSIARRAQDPLAELIKIDPQSIGVGMYQHDVDQPKLSAALGGVVESVVNHVGVDVNTASPALLTRVAGIGPKLAEKIVQHRDAAGPFRSRKALLKVSGLGPKAFEQAAGFLRVRDGEQPLDASAIHPESYAAAEALLRRAGLEVRSTPAARKPALDTLVQREPPETLAAALSIGTPTLRDVLEQLVRPGRDPREDAPPPILRADVLALEDLTPGLQLKGTVRNVVDFGAFVDIGVKQDGLLHRSRMPHGTNLSVGDIVDVEIEQVEAGRGRIALRLVGP